MRGPVDDPELEIGPKVKELAITDQVLTVWGSHCKGYGLVCQLVAAEGVGRSSISTYDLAIVHIYIQFLRTQVHATLKPVHFSSSTLPCH